jgi:hypothetical protein
MRGVSHLTSRARLPCARVENPPCSRSIMHRRFAGSSCRRQWRLRWRSRAVTRRRWSHDGRAEPYPVFQQLCIVNRVYYFPVRNIGAAQIRANLSLLQFLSVTVIGFKIQFGNHIPRTDILDYHQPKKTEQDWRTELLAPGRPIRALASDGCWAARFG